MPHTICFEKRKRYIIQVLLWTTVKHVEGRNTFKKSTVPVTQIDTYSSPNEPKLVHKRRGSVRKSKSWDKTFDSRNKRQILLVIST